MKKTQENGPQVARESGKAARLVCGDGLADDSPLSAVLLKNLEATARLDDATMQRRLLQQLISRYVTLERRVSDLLRNTLPPSVAEEIQYGEKFRTRAYECSILFADIVGFTGLAERISAEALIGLLDQIFRAFDDLISRYGGTKIKTIGDAYMVAVGAPEPCSNHAEQAVRLAMAMVKRMERLRLDVAEDVQMRVGIHSGRAMGGVVGRERMQFDIFGDNVNVAARFESSGEKGRVNVSPVTYGLTRHLFRFEARGEIRLKNKGAMKAYFVIPEEDGHEQD